MKRNESSVSRIGSFFRKRTLRRVRDSTDNDSDCEIPLVPSPPVVRQSSLQRQTSAPDDDASTQRYLLARGGIRFWKNFAYESEARPFIRVRHDIDPDQVSGVLVHEWLFSAPRIALVLISHVGPLGGWADARRLGEFRRGLLRAANATPMWLLTNGFNTGIAKEVGDAVSHELRRRQALRCHKHPNRTRATLPPLRLLGIVREDMLAGAELLDGRQSEVQIENEGNRPDEGKYELNPDHSNYVLVRDDTVNRTGLNQFVMRLEQRFIKLSDQQGPTSASGGDKESGGGGAELPLIALLVSGGEGCARLVLEHLKRQLPVVVFEGSGGLADLLAFAYREVQRRSPAVWDAEFVEGFLKPELASMLCLMYPAYRENALGRNLLRDRVVESVRLACQSNCLTLVDIRSRSCDLTRLDEILLNAFFRAQRPERVLRYNQMKKDLMLTIDWNCPDVAMSQVFLKDPSCKFQVDRDIFEEALIRPGREEFVQMFLERGFRVHKYLTPRRLKQLFKKVQGEQFFRSVCWEGALGRSPFSKLGKHFVESELNWLIETLTGLRGFVDSQELAMNAALGIYTLDPGAAERKALVLLALWCAFTQRTALGKRLWQCTDQPIHLALLVSMTYARLADLVHEGNTKKDLLDASEEFASMATGVLDCSYQEATCRAYDVLSEENPDWGHRTAVDIAARANNHKFLAHPCCQRWITNLFMGRISVRDLTWGPLAVPLWLKIILCAFLVFPMYIWVRFKSDPHEMEYKEEPEMEEEKDEREGDDEALLPDGFRAIDMQEQPPVPALTSETKVSFQPDAMTTLLRDRELFVPSPPPLWNMIYQMWNAPITKFWTFQIFYIAYLALFSVAVLLPSCGNRYVDMAVCAWTALIALESARRTYVLYTRYRDAPVFLRSVEVVLIAAFVAVYLVSRVLGPTPTIISAYGVKVVLCAALLGFYYRQIVIYLPISPTLGPLLYKVRLMVAEDFVNFMRMALLVIISGGIVAHALLYPDYPFNLELLRRTFHRAWFSLFLTPISDLEGDPRCLRLKVTNRSEEETCRVSDYTDYTCTNPGVWPYLFVIQFLVLLKLVLLTLLYALFSHTAHKIEAASDDIWKFQRYKLVVDFMNRLCLPPPLNIFSYLIALLQFLWRIISCRFCRTSHQLDGHADLGKSQLRLSEKDYNYWKHLASQYSQRLREEHDLEDGKKKQLESLSFFLEDMDHQRQMLSLLRGQIQELQRTVGKSFSYLQTLKHAADRPGEPGTVLPGAVHVLSRQSPYPRTRVLRYPVPDKYVAWQVLWLEYDPVAYSRPRADFPGHLQTHVDEDILGLRLASDGSGPLPSFAWNSVSTSPAGVSINRQSWIRDADGEQIIYRLDPQGMPMNPVGRTGLRGRGALPRWGPNHYVLFIITRWQRAKVHLVGGKGLEVVLMRVFRTDHFSLPGDFVPGEDKYATLKLLFKPETLSKCDTEEDVKQFFRGCHVEEEGVDDPSVEIRQRGYMDDPMNTDHCWREIELWNVHYHGQDTLLDRMQNHLLWRLVTEDLFTKLPLGQSVLLHEVTKMLQASII